MSEQKRDPMPDDPKDAAGSAPPELCEGCYCPSCMRRQPTEIATADFQCYYCGYRPGSGHWLDAEGAKLQRAAESTAASPALPTHRCSGCGLRWDGDLTGAELCGDCWRKGQAVIHGSSALPTLLSLRHGFEKNGIRFGERICCIDVPHVHGTVLGCSEEGVTVRWDDGTLGEAVWDQSVAHNAYRFQVVRRDTSEPQAALPTLLEKLIAKWRESRAHTYASENADLYRGFDNGCQRCADQLEAALASSGVGIGPSEEQWSRLYNLIANLAHPKGDHRENALEDEAHDLIRELRAGVGIGSPRPAEQEK